MSGTLNKGTLDKGSLIKVGSGNGGSPTPPSPTPQGEYFVKVIDYDGTVLDEKWLDDGEEYTFPAPPNRTSDGLVFQEWSCSQTIVNGKTTIKGNNVTAGAIYDTISGKSEFDVEFGVDGGTAYLQFNGTKDWGDGTTNTYSSHTYAKAGKYTIKLDGTSFYSNSSNTLFGAIRSNSYYYNYCLKAVRLTNIQSYSNTGNYIFWGCYNLETVSFSNTVKTLGNGSYIFGGNYKLKAVVLPSSLDADTAIGSAFGNSNYGLKKVVIPHNIKTFGSDCFTQNPLVDNFVYPESLTTFTNQYGPFDSSSSLNTKKIALPDGVTDVPQRVISEGAECLVLSKNTISVSSWMLEYAKTIKILDCSRCLTVPQLSDDYFYGSFSNDLLKIIVPFELYNTWINSKGWHMYLGMITTKESPATINFYGTNLSSVFVNKEEIDGTTTNYIGNSLDYVCYNQTDNVVVSSSISNIQPNDNTDVNIDFSGSKKITISVGVSNLDVKFIVDGVYFGSVEDSGDYYINIVADSGKTIKYVVNGGDTYLDVTGSITVGNTDVTETVTLSTDVTTQTFTRPNLSANGTLGGDSFAVEDVLNKSTNAYRAVDGSSSNVWQAVGYNFQYVIYNPNPIKVTGFSLSFYSGSSYAQSYQNQPKTCFLGSNDGENWEKITPSSNFTGSGVSFNNNNNYYKYYKLNLYSQPYPITNRYCRIYNISITATEKIANS